MEVFLDYWNTKETIGLIRITAYFKILQNQGSEVNCQKKNFFEKMEEYEKKVK